VARWFTGESTHKVDSKGRVSVPAAYRRVLEENDPDYANDKCPHLFLVYGDERRKFIEGYTVEAMAEVQAKISKKKRGTPKRRALERMFSGQTQQIQIDDTGRLVLSVRLREKLGITNEAFFIAANDTFQIWEPSTFAQTQAPIEALYQEYGDDFDPLMLLDADPAEE
jgi:transcriptional regulator MraZ